MPSTRGLGRSLSGQLNGELGAAGGQAGDAASASFGSKLTAGIAKAAKTAAVGLGALAVAAVGFGVKTAAENETAQISFETMLGSAEKAGAFLTQLKDFAAKTPFEFPELQKASSSLISAGVNANKVIPIMTTLGNVTSGMGTGSEGVQRATIALQQMAAAGKITGEDLNQLRDAGVPVFDLLAAATGKSKEEVAGLAQAGKLGKKELDQLFAALESGKGLERFNGLMEKQSLSLKGLLSTLKDTFGQGLGDALAPALPAIKASLGDLSTVLQSQLGTVGPVLAQMAGSVVQAFTALLPVLAPVLGAVAGLAGSLVTALLPVVQQLTPFVVEFVQILAGGLLLALQGLVPALGAVLVAVAPLLPPLARLAGTLLAGLAAVLVQVALALAPVIQAFLAGFLPVLDQITPLIPQLVAAFLPLIPPLGRLLVALTPLLVLLATLTDRVLIKLLPLLIPLAEAAAQWAATLIDQVIPAVTQVVGWITRLADALLGGNFAGAGTMLDGLWQAISGWFTGTALPGVAALAGQLGEAFTSWLSEVAPQIPGLLGAFAATIGTWITGTLLPFLAEQTARLGAALVAWIAQAAPQLPGLLLGLLAALGGWLIGTALPFLAEQGPVLAGALIGWVTTAAGWVVGRLGDLLSALGHWIAEVAVPFLIANGASLAIGLLEWIGKLLIELPVRLAEVIVAFNVWLYGTALPWLIQHMIDLVPALLSWIDEAIRSAPGRLLEFAGMVLRFVDSLGPLIGNAAKNAFVGLTNAFIASFNWIVRTWNQFRLQVPEIEVLGQKIGGFTLDTPDIGEVPYITGFAAGGRPTPGRPSIVGEKGPELWWPDQAGTVFPNSALQPAASGSRSGPLIGQVVQNGIKDARDGAWRLASELRAREHLAAGV